MRKLLIVLIVFPALSFAQRSKESNFLFQLNHIDICVDSITYHSLLKNKFINDAFSFTKTFNDSTGSEFLVLGQEDYIHFLPEKNFYKHRLGACLLVHHSFRWKETHTLIDYLQAFTIDSLYNRPYRFTNLTIDYINVYEDLKDTSRLLKFIPILANGSKEAYFDWGYKPEDLQNGITQKKYMADYVGKETKGKLFQNIRSIEVTASTEEQIRIEKLLRGYGYKRMGSGMFCRRVLWL